MVPLRICIVLPLISWISASSTGEPPKSALFVAFEEQYELSLLANTFSDQSIASAIIVPTTSEDLYDDLLDVEVIRIDVPNDGSTKEATALLACEILLTSAKIEKLIAEFAPTVVIFPALRYDACLLPWINSFKAIPVLWAQGPESESYTFHRSGIAFTVHDGGFWTRLSSLFALRSSLTTIDGYYVNPALDLVDKYLSDEKDTLENLYERVDLIFWGADPILRSETAAVSQLLVEIGCHHCRGAHPVPTELQKQLVEFRSGTIAVLLDDAYGNLVAEIAKNLPQGRQGQAIVWKNKNVSLDGDKPDNLFVNNDVLRQDLIGFPRTRILLSHCDDTELLETTFHGTPVICFPRTSGEYKNSRRAVDLGISVPVSEAREPTEILLAIKEIHESARYRENARKASNALRDRPIPPIDRITYWLGYVSRYENEHRYLSAQDNRKISYTAAHSSDLFLTLGFLVGLISGAIIPSAYILAGKLLAANAGSTIRTQKPKRKYKS